MHSFVAGWLSSPPSSFPPSFSISLLVGRSSADRTIHQLCFVGKGKFLNLLEPSCYSWSLVVSKKEHAGLKWNHFSDRVAVGYGQETSWGESKENIQRPMKGHLQEVVETALYPPLDSKSIHHWPLEIGHLTCGCDLSCLPAVSVYDSNTSYHMAWCSFPNRPDITDISPEKSKEVDRVTREWGWHFSSK